MKFFEVPSTVIFKVSGKDSQRYLNARLTNDIKSLQGGMGCLAAMLTPQGRTQGLFVVLRPDDNEYYLICDGGNPAELEAALKKYIVADRVTVEQISMQFKLIHLFDTPKDSAVLEVLGVAGPNLQEYYCVKSGDFIAYGNRRVHEGGLDILAGTELQTKLLDLLSKLGAQPIERERHEKLRFAAGIPAFPAEINEERLFSESGLMHAVSFKKGCYVGQEVVEKIDAHGKLPKVLRSLVVEAKSIASQESVLANSEDQSEPRAIGKIVSACYDETSDRTFCFATIKNEPELGKLTLTVAGNKARLNEHSL